MSKNNSILCGQCESTNTKREIKKKKNWKKKKMKEIDGLFVWCWNFGHFERGKRWDSQEASNLVDD